MFATDVFSSTDIISAIGASFGIEDEVLGLGLGLSLLPYTILGIAFVSIGSVILVLRREKVTVNEKVTALLECPLCKH